MMSMAEQIARMRQSYPAFNVVFNGGWHVIWEGPLRPFSQTYLVRMEAVEPRVIGDLRVVGTWGANVTLISPELQLSTDKAPGEEIPHLYRNESNLRMSRLCLFDPATTEWAPGNVLAETIIPWTIDWLASYEGWRATGEWTGGGRHPEILK